MSSVFKCGHIDVTYRLKEHWAENGRIIEEQIKRLVNRYIDDSVINYILDGYPNSIAQYEGIENKPDLVIYLKMLDNTELVERLTARDGYEGTPFMENIIQDFYSHTEPLIKFLKDRNKIATVYGDFNVGKVLGKTALALSAHKVVDVDNYIADLIKQHNKFK